MARFITAHSRIQQVEKPGYWKTLDNELFMDDDGSLYIVPRFFWSDGYTFPGLIMAFLGDKHFYDVRPAHGHDLGCRFHEVMKVELSLTQLKLKGYLRMHQDMVVCDDIPLEYITVVKKSKTWVDNFFKRMMVSCNIPKNKIRVIRLGVFFNLNWWLKTGKKHILEYDIYHEDIGLVNGV